MAKKRSPKKLLQGFYDVIIKGNTEVKNTLHFTLFDEKAISKLKNVAYGCYEDTVNNEGYKCDLAEFFIKMPQLPRNCYNPQPTINSLQVGLTVDITFKKNQKNRIHNPIHSLFFVVTTGTPKPKASEVPKPKAFQSWHLDYESPPIKGALHSDFLHPVFHISIGGNAIKDKINEDYNFGETLVMGTPRFTHPPMDIILGIDFILNHYIAYPFSDIILSSPTYKEIVQEMKDILWKPFALAFAKNFCDELKADGITLDIDAPFAKAIIQGWDY